jgi:hypothetical protein
MAAPRAGEETPPPS